MKRINFTTRVFVLLLLSCVTLVQPANAQRRKQRKADKETKAWRYEMEPVGVGMEGSYQVKVWSYSKNVKIAIEQAKKNAVHGIIFKGFAGKGRLNGLEPLERDPNLTPIKKSFFNKFFKQGGDYLKFVTLVANGHVGAGDRIKLRRGEYKIGVVVTVKVSQLRKYLEANGMIKSLSSGF